MSDERRPPQGYGEQPELQGGDQWGEPGAMSAQSARDRYPAPQRAGDRPVDRVEPPQPARPPERVIERPPDPVMEPPTDHGADRVIERRTRRSGADRRNVARGRVTGGYVDRDYGPPIGAGRRGSPKLIAILGVPVLCLIGGLLYFVALGNDLPGGLGSTDGDIDVDVDVDVDGGQAIADDEGDGADENPPVSTETDTTALDGDGGEADSDGGDGAPSDNDEGGDATDGEDSPDTTVGESGPDSTVALGLSSEVDGVLDSDRIVLTGTARTQDEVDRLVERLAVLTDSGTVDASAIEIDPASPPVRELALTVSGQIGFSVNSDVIEPDFVPILDRVVEFMQADQTINVAVLGHTDADGIDFENLALSQRRAEAVVVYLVEGGVNSFRLEPLGRGSTEPVASNDTAEGRADNRRIEFTILGLDI